MRVMGTVAAEACLPSLNLELLVGNNAARTHSYCASLYASLLYTPTRQEYSLLGP